MENYIVIDGKKVELSQETVDNLKKSLQKKELPKSWEELKEIEGFYTNGVSSILFAKSSPITPMDRNIWPTKELAKASLAMSQLAQLRDRYNDGWRPDWMDDNPKFVISFWADDIESKVQFEYSRFLTFKTPELRDTFLENFRDLIETAKPLL